MFIRNGVRFNIYATQTIDDVTYGDFTSPELRAALNITEEPDPAPPEDYSEDTYYRIEQDEAPYVVYTMKSTEQLVAMYDGKIRAQKDIINSERDSAMIEGVLHNDKLWHCDDRFLIELIGMIMGYQAGIYTGTQLIRTKENTIETLTLPQIMALASAVGAHRKTVYANSWAVKDALDAAGNPYIPVDPPPEPGP